MITYVYIDGFNLYYGCLKGTPFRWLDLRKLCQNLLPPNQIEKIKYSPLGLVNARITPANRCVSRCISERWEHCLRSRLSTATISATSSPCRELRPRQAARSISA